MTMAHDQRLVRRAIAEIFNLGQLSVADDLFAADYVNHGGLIPDLVSGPEVVKFSAGLYRRAFPNLRITIDALGGDEDVLVMDWSARNRRLGAVPEIDPTGEARDRMTGVTRVRCAGGMIAESWTDWDSAAMLRLMGIDEMN